MQVWLGCTRKKKNWTETWL